MDGAWERLPEIPPPAASFASLTQQPRVLGVIGSTWFPAHPLCLYVYMYVRVYVYGLLHVGTPQRAVFSRLQVKEGHKSLWLRSLP